MQFYFSDVYKRQGQDYRIVKGDAHDVMRQVLNGAFDGLFTIPEEPSGCLLYTSTGNRTD